MKIINLESIPFRHFELGFRWFLGEIAFVLLPLAIIISIRLFLGVEVGELLVLPEWSFAAIVMLSSGLNKFLELKTKLQRDFSNRIFHGTKIAVLLLILASVTLAFAVAGQHGIRVSSLWLSISHISLLALSGGFLFLAIYFELDHEIESTTLSNSLNKLTILRYLNQDLEAVEIRLRRLHWALSKRDSPIKIGGSKAHVSPPRSAAFDELLERSKRVSNFAAEIEKSIACQSQQA